MAKRRKSGIRGVSFSAKRAFGVTKAKRRIAKVTGIPTTKQGRRNKAARMMGCGGCLVQVLAAVLLVAFAAAAIAETIIR